MRKLLVSALALCLMMFLVTGCTPREEKLTLELPKLTEPKKVDLTHELYVSENKVGRAFSYSETLRVFDLSVEKLGSYCYLEQKYEEQNIQSVKEAISYYERIDPDDMISKRSFVIAEVNYDPEYDVWCFWLCPEEYLVKFQDTHYAPTWCVYFSGNGQFLFRLA